MSYAPLILVFVIFFTFILNYKNNRCPNCNKWKLKGFDRLDNENFNSNKIEVYCNKCSHTWSIDYKESDFKPKR
jgi:hypothetical protein